MIFLFKKLVFKMMELGLGLRTCFSLDTKDPIFVNFRLSPEEARAVEKALPAGFSLEKLRFCEGDAAPEHWISYNLYEIRYPKGELRHVRKVRCEINTFVRDPDGRKGVYVFCDSPYVSRRERAGAIELICDLAERTVTFIYGCGKLVRLGYELTQRALRIELAEGPNRVSVSHDLSSEAEPRDRLSDDYCLFNDISFFNRGRTYDLVNVNSAFFAARLHSVRESDLSRFEIAGPFFRRAPDRVYYHRGEISYLVNSMNRHGHTAES